MSEPFAIFETEHWKAVLHAEDQTYLGRSVVVCKRSVGSLSELTEDEWLDFMVMVRRFESAVKAAFGATLFNWGCLMNLAYRENEPKPQVHWHVRPRYAKPVSFAGETFTDDAFGSHYLRDTQRKVSRELAERIVASIRSKR